jgi:hypothetical protein
MLIIAAPAERVKYRVFEAREIEFSLKVEGL